MFQVHFDLKFISLMKYSRKIQKNMNNLKEDQIVEREME